MFGESISPSELITILPSFVWRYYGDEHYEHHKGQNMAWSY